MYQTVFRQIQREYEIKRNKAIEDSEKRKKDLRMLYPEYTVLEENLNNFAIEQAKALITKGGIDKQVVEENLETKIKELNSAIEKFLVTRGMSKDYLKPRYECRKCNDTGVMQIDGIDKKCSCFVQKLVNITYKQSNMLKLKEENFNTFDTCFFSNVPNKEKYGSDKSPLENIENIKKIAIDFCNNIENPNQKSLLLIGNTGTGKTFMSNAIADRVISKGYTVLYQTAPVLMDMMLDSKIRGNKEEELRGKYEQIFDVDLLIIDDLGTETLNSMKFTELFNIINTRLLKNKKTIISTNLVLPELAEQYDARVMSRLIGNYIICKFFGEDIRLKKKMMEK
ncbi:MAG: ATP-binding protein [Clostridia bacterium]|nr:ATP-binding protein [Clostridia bacterium]